jgi:hypothetical protein
MASRKKYKVDQNVEFYFAGSYHTGVIINTKIIGNQLRYSILSDDGTTYPVAENNIKKVL